MYDNIGFVKNISFLENYEIYLYMIFKCASDQIKKTITSNLFELFSVLIAK